MWIHFECVNISDEQKIPEENYSWICGDYKLLAKWQGLFRFIYIGLGYNQTEKVCILKILLNLAQV